MTGGGSHDQTCAWGGWSSDASAAGCSLETGGVWSQGARGTSGVEPAAPETNTNILISGTNSYTIGTYISTSK